MPCWGASKEYPQHMFLWRNIKDKYWKFYFNSFPTSGDFCHLLITFANSLDPDQAWKKCRAWSGSKLFDTLMVFLTDFFEKVNFKKIYRRQKSMQNYPACKVLKNPYLKQCIQGPVVQSIVSLTSLLRVISLTVLADSMYNILIFFAEKMWVAFALQKLLTFFQQKISA